MIGESVAHYLVSAKIGAGGMGEVYRATDTRLKREVALKVLPESFTNDTQRMARFQREAEVLASLNHTNIAGIYGLERSGDTQVLVLELVEGEDLAEVISRGPIPFETAVRLAIQIADALEAAHQGGIIHRDLKPANIKICPEGQVKVLDFGLAKAVGGAGTTGDISHSPTLTMQASEAGMILGTASYMSPEQAKGRPVDKRTDIWAFGVILFEMLTGSRPFDGGDISEILASVIKTDPDLDRLSDEPPAMRRLLRRCLEKDKTRRLADIADARLELQDALQTEQDPDAAPVSSRRRAVPYWLVLATALGGVLVGWLLTRLELPRTNIERPLLATLKLPEGTRLSGGHPDEARIGGSRPAEQSFAWLPDQSGIIFAAADDQGIRLYRRQLDAEFPIEITGTDGGHSPSISPDGLSLAFLVKDRLMRAPVSGGDPRVLYSAAPFEELRAPWWQQDDTILLEIHTYGEREEGIFRVDPTGGKPERVLTSVPGLDAFNLRNPKDIPGAHGALLFGVAANERDWSKASIYVRAPGKPPRILIEQATEAEVWGNTILFARDGKLYGATFDTSSLEVISQPLLLVDGLVHSVNEGNSSIDSGDAQFAVSGPHLAVARGGGPEFAPTPLTLVDENGVGQTVGSGINGADARVSPEGRRVVVVERKVPGNRDLLVLDFQSKAERRFEEPGSQTSPAWSPDGSRLAYASDPTGIDLLYVRNADGTGEPEKIGQGLELLPESWSSPTQIVGLRGRTLVVVDLKGGQARDILQGVVWPALSPDHRWVAYSPEPPGQGIQVRPFPAAEPVYRISETGTRPAWSRDGKRLYFRSGQWDRYTMMVVNIEVSGETIIANEVRELFRGVYGGTSPMRSYDVLPDGHFLMYPDRSARPQPVHEIQLRLNWLSEIKALLAGRK